MYSSPCIQECSTSWGYTSHDDVPDVDVAVTATDDDAVSGVTLSVSPGSVSESGGTATVS